MNDRPELIAVDDALVEELATVDALPPYLTREEAWTFLRISEATLDRALERGDLARRRIGDRGGRTVVPRASIRAWVLRQAGHDGAEPVERPAIVGVPKPKTEGSPTCP